MSFEKCVSPCKHGHSQDVGNWHYPQETPTALLQSFVCSRILNQVDHPVGAPLCLAPFGTWCFLESPIHVVCISGFSLIIAESFPLCGYIRMHLSVCLSMDVFWSFSSTCTLVFNRCVNLCNYFVGNLEAKQKEAEKKTQPNLSISGKYW